MSEVGLPTKDRMLEVLGSSEVAKVVERFNRLASIPSVILTRLVNDALHEEWGNENYALRKYLSIQLCWAIEQETYTTSERSIFFSAGHIQTRYGTPLYLGFEKNTNRSAPYLLHCTYAGPNPPAPTLPTPPSIPAGPPINKAVEIVMLHDHMLRDNEDRVPFLSQTPRVAQMCAISGSIQWSLNRNLELPYFYFGKMNYLVPLYLNSRENITEAPDLIAPVQINSNSMVVRTILLPYMAYANARVAVERHDRLPSWMLSAWNQQARTLTEQQIETADIQE